MHSFSYICNRLLEKAHGLTKRIYVYRTHTVETKGGSYKNFFLRIQMCYITTIGCIRLCPNFLQIGSCLDPPPRT